MVRLGISLIISMLCLLVAGCSSTPKAATKPESWAASLKEVVQGPPADEEAVREYFNQGEELFSAAAEKEGEERTKGFEEAAKQYFQATKRAPGTPLEEDALLMTSESLFFADRYVKASEAMDRLVKRYPLTRHMDRVDQRRFRIAEYWLGLTKAEGSNWLPKVNQGSRPATDTFGHAIRLFDKIRFDDPTGKLADDATMAAGVANFEQEKYWAADVLFTDVRDNFPKSEHQFQAHMLGLKCKMMMYDGPDYDSGSIDDAEEIIKSMVKLYPQESEPHREYLETAYKDVRLKKANRDYSLAEFYDRRKEFGAARIYYQEVIKNYSDTSLALESESRLAAIGGLPPVPDQPMEWLANLFPDEEQAKPFLARDDVDTKVRRAPTWRM